MTPRTRTTVTQIAGRVRRGMSEMSYVQRRVFENRTGIPVSGRNGVPDIATTRAELETLYARDSD